MEVVAKDAHTIESVTQGSAVRCGQCPWGRVLTDRPEFLNDPGSLGSLR